MSGNPALLVVVPHPDDETYAFGGTIALAADAGWHAVVHCASSGERGKRHDGGPADRDSVRQVREAEFRESCRVLGAETVSFWRMPDGAVTPSAEDTRRLSDVLHSTGPAIVLTLGADGAYGHPDHIAVHRWVVSAWKLLDVRPEFAFAAFPAGLFLPQYRKCISMMGDPPSPSPDDIGSAAADVAVDISAARDRKVAAVACHASQLPGGDPYRLFPATVLAGTLEQERFTLHPESERTHLDALLASLPPPSNVVTPLEQGHSIGVESARWLRDVGIGSLEELRRAGAVEAYLRVRASRPSGVTLNLLYALNDAVTGRRWREVPATEREELRAMVQIS
jgi:LmbE family N-acetylglucosaminyl deacetylase